MSGQGCPTKVLDQSLHPHPGTQRRTHQHLPHTVLLTTGLNMAIRVSQMHVSVQVIAPVFLLGTRTYPPTPPPPKIFQDVWNANKTLLGRSFSALVKYLVWKLFQYLNEVVSFCRNTSYNREVLYKRSIIWWKILQQTEAGSWH